ncbi:MAG: hypothetical protein WB999_12265 [Candidatus Binataceae bacterium]
MDAAKRVGELPSLRLLDSSKAVCNLQMKKMVASAAKRPQSGADIADNWKIPAVLRNLGSRMLQNSRLSALE